jgi:hypothetical protein
MFPAARTRTRSDNRLRRVRAEAAQTTPDVSVVVASHRREARLRTLLDALAAQTFPRGRWELVVAHTYEAATAAGLFDDHELTRSGVMRAVAADPSNARPSVQRNAGVAAARGRLIVFTDDDCRPEPDWLESLVARYEESGAPIVQGATRPDPLEADRLLRPHVRTLFIDPPSGRAETCNILYERELFERVGGFDERATTGEDMDLALRAQAAGARVVGAPEALSYHGVDALSIPEKIRSQYKWQHLAYVVKRNPVLREGCEWGIWWKPEHLRATVALVGMIGARRRPWMLLAVVPYLRLERWRHGPGKRQQLRSLREAPAHWLIEIVEVGTFAVGSVRYRTILL